MRPFALFSTCSLPLSRVMYRYVEQRTVCRYMCVYMQVSTEYPPVARSASNVLTCRIQGPSHGRRRAGQRSQSNCSQLFLYGRAYMWRVWSCLQASGLLTLAAAVVMLAQCVKHATAPVDALHFGVAVGLGGAHVLALPWFR